MRAPPGTPSAKDDAAWLVVDLGGSKISGARVHGARIHDRWERRTNAQDGPDAIVAAIADAVAGRLEPGEALGVAATGRVVGGRVHAVNTATLPGWRSVPLAARLHQATGARVVVLNDAHAAAWGEARHGAGRGARTFAFVTLSTGVGAGLVVDGTLLRGAHGLAGHVGFWRDLEPDGDSGALALERRASGVVLQRWASAALGRPVTSPDVLAAAREGEPAARAAVEEVLSRVARALVNLQWLIDPERIALGGGLGLAEGVLDDLRGRLDASPLTQDGVRVVLVPAQLGADAGLVGMADWLASHERAGAEAT